MGSVQVTEAKISRLQPPRRVSVGVPPRRLSAVQSTSTSTSTSAIASSARLPRKSIATCTVAPAHPPTKLQRVPPESYKHKIIPTAQTIRKRQSQVAPEANNTSATSTPSKPRVTLKTRTSLLPDRSAGRRVSGAPRQLLGPTGPAVHTSHTLRQPARAPRASLAAELPSHPVKASQTRFTSQNAKTGTRGRHSVGVTPAPPTKAPTATPSVPSRMPRRSLLPQPSSQRC